MRVWGNITVGVSDVEPYPVVSHFHAALATRLFTSVAAAVEFSMEAFHKAYLPKGTRVLVTRCGKLLALCPLKHKFWPIQASQPLSTNFKFRVDQADWIHVYDELPC
jgi:hypothetical protein